MKNPELIRLANNLRQATKGVARASDALNKARSAVELAEKDANRAYDYHRQAQRALTAYVESDGK